MYVPSQSSLDFKGESPRYLCIISVRPYMQLKYRVGLEKISKPIIF